MTDEGFLLALAETPNDDATRLIYADWLEDQDDEASKRKADYIRLDCELAARGEETHDTKRRQRLAEKIESAWLAVVSKGPIERCTFQYECPKKWENLAPVEGIDTTRYCDECKREVYFCATLELAREHAWQGHCVAVDARHTRSPGDIEPGLARTVGEMA